MDSSKDRSLKTLTLASSTTPESDNEKIDRTNDSAQTIRTTITFKPDVFSSTSDGFTNQFGSMNTPLPLLSDGSSQMSQTFSLRLPSLINLPPQNFSDNTLPSNSNIGKRRGHRYKHSSVSAQHQIFLEPPPRAPLALPASLPIPTLKEAYSSRSREQTSRAVCCLCHILVAFYVYYSAVGSLALTALSHLIFFDAISATICVIVDVISNFEVWKRSSLRHPFGLERAEVLAGFAMSIFLTFMGLHLTSHNIKHALEMLGIPSSVDHHSEKRTSLSSVDSAALLSIIATSISAIGLKNHARIGKTMRYTCISFLPSILSNPSHFLTLVSSTVMLLLPLFSITMYHWIDRIFCTIIAISIFALGTRLALTQGQILLMSYSAEGVSEIIRKIKEDPMVVHVEEAKFWQVHYALCIASLKLRVSGEDKALTKLRERISSIIVNRLGNGSVRGEMKWEVTTQFILEK
ncbi:putative zinc transporter zrg17 [Golovinomyces cichoracearum]|uniref:Zinc transporter n=1 Tax=Golovinomyces cichoracearum TaxID=62708 RepID=A0A420IGG3_9PEZI|nr:putative zinc transporter zrg17 [Golovinomyces cichoracearum]